MKKKNKIMDTNETKNENANVEKDSCQSSVAIVT